MLSDRRPSVPFGVISPRGKQHTSPAGGNLAPFHLGIVVGAAVMLAAEHVPCGLIKHGPSASLTGLPGEARCWLQTVS